MDDAEVEALADRIAGLPPEKTIDVLLAMLERIQDENDRLEGALRKRVLQDLSDQDQYDQNYQSRLAAEAERDRLRDRLEEETDEYDRILGRQAELLTGVANALKGQPPELVMHDWSDLPSVAAAIAAERNQLRDERDTERAQWLKETRHAARRIGTGVRERDQLRAVERAARGYLTLIDSTTATPRDRQEGMTHLRLALRAYELWGTEHRMSTESEEPVDG